jgi:hypothetical protein
MSDGYLEKGKSIVDGRRGGWSLSSHEAEIDYLRHKKDWAALAEWAAHPRPELNLPGEEIRTLIHDTAAALSRQRTRDLPVLRDRWKKLAHAQTWYADECIFFLWAMDEREAAVEIILSLLQPNPNAFQMPTFHVLMRNPDLVADPRIVGLMHRWGLFAYWRDSGRWPDFCADPALPYDCKAEAQRLASRR